MNFSRMRNGVVVFVGVVAFLISCHNNPKQNKAGETKIEKPNLLYIFPDQLRNAAIGINGEDPVYTPNLNQLAKDGILLSNAIANFPLCSPIRAMLTTGKLPYNNSVLTNANSQRYRFDNSWQRDDVSFSDVLVKNGYDAGYVRKLHLTSPPPIAGKDSVIWDAYTPKEDRHGFNFWYAYGTFDVHNHPHYWVNDAKEDELKYVDEWSPKHDSDHGEMMGSHGLISKNIWYEEAINVPFIVRWPEKIKAGQKSDLLLGTPDIMPTLLNMMGATNGIPTDLDGQDLSSQPLTGKGESPKYALYYFIEEGRPESGHSGIRTAGNTYVITVDDSGQVRKFLYDNVNDPYQMINLAGKDPQTEQRLHAELLEALKAKNDPWLDTYKSL